MKKRYFGVFLLLTTLCFGQNEKTAYESNIPKKDNYSFYTINFDVLSLEGIVVLDALQHEIDPDFFVLLAKRPVFQL